MTQERYHIRIKGYLDRCWSDCFDGFTITNVENGEAILSGTIVDQAALHGVLMKIRDLGLPLIAVNQIEPHSEDRQHGAELAGKVRAYLGRRKQSQAEASEGTGLTEG